MKRGVAVEGLHFHSYPFTTERSKEKVMELGRHPGTVYRTGIVQTVDCHFTEVRKRFKSSPMRSLRITLMRRVYAAHRCKAPAEQQKVWPLLQGDSLGQGGQPDHGKHVHD